MPVRHYEAVSRPRDPGQYPSQPAGIPSSRQTNKDASHHFNRNSVRPGQAKSASESPWAFTNAKTSQNQVNPRDAAVAAATRNGSDSSVRWARKQSGNRKNLEDKVWEFEGKAAEGSLGVVIQLTSC